MKRPSDLKAFFANIAEQLEMDFQYGNSRRILNRQSANLTYPVLWLEKPSMRRTQEGSPKAVFRSAFVVLINVAPHDDWEAADQAQDDSWVLTEKILNRLDAEDDNSPPAFEFRREQCSSECLEYFSGDADTGWRTEFEIKSTFCIKDDFWAGLLWAGSDEYFGAGGGGAMGNE